MDEPMDTLQVAERLIGAGVPDEQAKAHAAVLVDAMRAQQLSLERRMVTAEQLSGALAPIHIELARHGVELAALTGRIEAVEKQLVATEARLVCKIAQVESKIGETEARLIDKIAESAKSVLARSRSQAFEAAITTGLLQGSLIAGLLMYVLK